MSNHSGAWRKITKEEADKLAAEGAKVDWMEGVGMVVFDAQALCETQAQAEAIRRQTVSGNSPKGNAMGIRCKMTLENVFANTYGGSKAIFRCTYDSKVAEDVSFQKATPSGMAEFVVDNPKAAEQLVIGQAYYVDFTPATAA